MDCPECVHLLAECERLNEAYTAAFDTMIERSGTMAGADFTSLRVAADHAWLESERVRLELREHKRRHAGSELSHTARF
jgi:glycerol dehydrogenase-like iron-containing ADH family enzyme